MLVLRAWRLLFRLQRLRLEGGQGLLVREMPEERADVRRPAANPRLTIVFTRLALEVAARLVPFRITCLQRSVALQQLLHQQGVHTRLRIGVRKERGVLDAHAWLEHEGAILNGSAEHCGRYQPLDEPPRMDKGT